MASYRRLQATVEAALASPHLAPQDRSELAHVLHVFAPDFQSFLQYPTPKAEDRAQVVSREVNLPNAPPTILDDQDAQIALKLSEDFHLNEVYCVSLLVAAHQEWNLLGRDPLEVLRLTAGLWFSERRALITTLLLLLRTVVLDEEMESDVVADIWQYVRSMLDSALRKRLMELIKELNRAEPAGLGGPGVEPYVMDSRGALVLRHDIAQRERLNLSQCLVYTCLIVRISAPEVKDFYNLLKDSAADLSIAKDPVKLQIEYTLMFSIVMALISDALGGTQEMAAVLAPDCTFRQSFQELVTGGGLDMMTEGFTGVIRLAWAVFLMLTSGLVATNVEDEANASVCLNRVCEHDVFSFITNTVIRSAAFQNDEEDLLFMYNAYLHKLLTGFLSQPVGREKIRELKELSMVPSDAYEAEKIALTIDEDERVDQQALQAQGKPFVSFLELIAEVYQRELELVAENEVVWNFVRFAGEDHTSYVTLVAFLHMLTALASSENGAKRVYQLMQNKAIRTLGWHTLFGSLSVYEQQFKQMKQTTGALLPSFPEGDARALEAYLGVLRQVIECGNEVERSQWFTDIEPLFKLLPYENVPPRLKGALRSAITAFVSVSHVLKDKVWRFLEQYDLPVSAAPSTGDVNFPQVQSKIHDMAFELNEVEARQEEYPSTLSYLELLNVLIASDTDHLDKGQRYIGIFRFVRDQVFAPYAQRAYADPVEKWQLVVAALQHFQTMLSLYQLSEEDIQNSADHAIPSNGGVTGGQAAGGTRLQLPIVELMKDLMSGKIIFRNIMGILMIGVNSLLEQRTSQLHGLHLEEAVQLGLQLILLALNKDAIIADFWRPAYQTLDVILSHDSRQIISLLEYVRYEPQPLIQQYSIQITSILSARMPRLVSIIMEAGAVTYIVEDYAACLEACIQDTNAVENSEDDTGSLILRLLLENLDRPTPNFTHLLLRFDMDQPVERTVLQPKRHYSCLRVILNLLDTLSKPQVNYVVHELGFQLMYELCMDPVTSGATVELLRTDKYDFFSKHLVMFSSDPLASRGSNQALRVSSLQQRAWLLKLAALELHMGDMDVTMHREGCRQLLGRLFLRDQSGFGNGGSANSMPLRLTHPSSEVTLKMKVLELLDVIQFPLPDIDTEFPQELQAFKDELKVDEILSDSSTDMGGVYRVSERGDRLIDISALRDRVWQEYKRLEVQHNILTDGRFQAELREAVKQLIRWAWKRNINLEEQAAQLHMLVGWSQLVEVVISRRFDFLGSRPQILFEILDACLTAILSSDCSLRMASTLCQVVLTAMAKLQELSIVSPGEGESMDDVTYIDLLSTVRLSNSACHTILSKLIAGILRPESSENLRRRQFATLLRYLHYCQGLFNHDLPLGVMQTLLVSARDGEEDAEIEKLDREQTELAQGNFSILKQEATALVDIIAKDARHGTEVGKAIAFYVLDVLIGLDRQQVFFSQLQSRGLLQTCLADVSNNSYQAVLIPSPDSVRRLYTIEAELGLLLRVSHHSRKRGTQALFAMGALRNLISCRAIDVQITETARWEQAAKVGMGLPSQHDRQHQIVAPVLRLVLCFTSLVDTSAPFEKEQDEVALEILEFCKVHQGLLDRILRDDGPVVDPADLEELQLVTAMLSKVWPLEDSLEFGFTRALFNLAYVYFAPDSETRSRYIQHLRDAERNTELTAVQRETLRKLELLLARVRCNLITFVYALVTKQGLRLHITRPDMPEPVALGQYSLGRQRQPTLKLVSDLLHQSSVDLESALEEKALLLAKLEDVNELSRQEVDFIIKTYGRQEDTDRGDTLRKRRYLAMIEMCSAAGMKESLVSSLMYIVEHALEILYIHFENRLARVKTEERYDHGSHFEALLGTTEELRTLTDKLLLIFDKLGAINKDRVGQATQHLHRLVHSLKSRISQFSDSS